METNLMKFSLTEDKLIEIISRGTYWKEVVNRDDRGNIFYEELQEVRSSIGSYCILAILNNYAEVQYELIKNQKEGFKC